MTSRTEKFRGSRTHGRGMKAGRGAGKRGGRGNAGLHKHKYLHTVKFKKDHFGRKGFKRPQSVVSANEIINVRWLVENPDMADTSSDMPVFNLHEMGIDKLLGAGNIDSPVKVIVEKVSASAKKKIESSGGEIINPDTMEETTE